MNRRIFMTGMVAAVALLTANVVLADPMGDAKALVEKCAGKVSASAAAPRPLVKPWP